MGDKYRCSNPACRSLHDRDPQGHCPTCKGADGSGWSCVLDTGFECVKCGHLWPAGQMAMKCVTCGSVYCPACKDVPGVHSFACYAGQL
jgi:hypothetical protein